MTTSTVTGAATVGSQSYPATATVTLPPAAPGQKPYSGSTVNPSAYQLPGTAAGIVEAAKTWDGYVGRVIAQTCQKRYEQATPAASGKIKAEYTALPGAHYLVSFKPGWVAPTTATPSPLPGQSQAEFDKLAAYVAFLKSGGVSFDACLWQECNLPEGPFKTPDAYISWANFYAAAIRQAGIRLLYDPGASDPATAASYYPGDPITDGVVCDYYTGAYFGGKAVRLDPFAALADSRKDGKKVPFGIAEYGDNISGTKPDPNFDTYAGYIADFFAARLKAGQKVYGAICFGWNGPSGAGTDKGTYNTMTSSTDHKIPGIQKIHDTLTA